MNITFTDWNTAILPEQTKPRPQETLDFIQAKLLATFSIFTTLELEENESMLG